MAANDVTRPPGAAVVAVASADDFGEAYLNLLHVAEQIEAAAISTVSRERIGELVLEVLSDLQFAIAQFRSSRHYVVERAINTLLLTDVCMVGLDQDVAAVEVAVNGWTDEHCNQAAVWAIAEHLAAAWDGPLNHPDAPKRLPKPPHVAALPSGVSKGGAA